MHGHIQKDYKKRLIHRLKIMQGQMTGLLKMIDDEAYCVDVLNQSSAIQESLKSFDALMLENHLRTHVTAQFRGKHPEHAVDELVNVFTYGRK